MPHKDMDDTNLETITIPVNVALTIADYQRVSRWAAAVHPSPDNPEQPDWNAAWKEILAQGILTIFNPGVTPMPDNLAAAWRQARAAEQNRPNEPGQ